MGEFVCSDSTLFTASLITLYASAAVNVLSLPFITAPYGRHARSGWGPTIPPSLAWFLMESPTLLLSCSLLLFLPRGPTTPLSVLLLSLFFLHYVHRTLVYPLRLNNNNIKKHHQQQQFPLSIALMAFTFNVLNAYLQTRSISCYVVEEEEEEIDHGWKAWVRVLVGVGIFGWGMWVNVTSDLHLVRLKAEGKGYRIPEGGWFEYVCSPNYMGEAAEWFGWAVAAGASPAAWGFFLYTCSNLVPRARANLRWYRDKFGEEFPRSRKAIVPFVF